MRNRSMAKNATQQINKRRLLPQFGLKPRHRDQHNNTVVQMFAYTSASPDDTRLQETDFNSVLEQIEWQDPEAANRLRAFYNHNVVKLLGEYHQLRGSLAEAWFQRRQVGLNLNRDIDKRQLVLRRKAATAAQSFVNKIADLDKALRDLHHKAAVAVTATGGVYNPAAPDEKCVLREQKRTIKEMSAILKVPSGPPVSLLPKAALTVIGVLLGIFFGMSLGFENGSLDPKNLMAAPFMVALFLSLGMVIAVCAGFCVYNGHAVIGEQRWLGRPVKQWRPMAIRVIALDIFFVVIDAILQQRGMLALTHSNAFLQTALTPPTGDTSITTTLTAVLGDELRALILGAAVSIAYFSACAWLGTMHGRQKACDNRLMLAREEDFKQRDKAQRNCPKNRAALIMIGKVQQMLVERQQVTEQMQAAMAPFEKEIVRLQSVRVVIEDDLPEKDKQVIEDARHDWIGAHYEFQGMLEEARQM